MKRLGLSILVAVAMLTVSACQETEITDPEPDPLPPVEGTVFRVENDQVTDEVMYVPFTLTSDLSGLSENTRKMIPLLIEAARTMDDAFWMQAFGDKSRLDEYKDPAIRSYLNINYGPWDRLNENRPFCTEFGPKPAGANFYPSDMTKEEFDAANDTNESLSGLYTMVRRAEGGGLEAIPYSTHFSTQYEAAAAKLREAADLAEDEGLKKYLNLRAEALLSDDYLESDLAWMDMKSNPVDIVIGPIETYEDALYGQKAANEAYVLIKDAEWSERLQRYAALLPVLQEGLPVPAEYKTEEPGTDSDLNAYDVVYYAGDCNAGSKTIAINLPNDERVQLEKGTRRLQLKNAMRAKFDAILESIADELVDPSQRSHITFDAFFSNTMFHEVAHGLGIKNTLNDRGTVREALKEHASALEEGKADVLGLYMVTKLHEMGELGDIDLMDNYVTFMAGIFRSVRFGASSAHGKANMIRFNYFMDHGAFERDESTGKYAVNFEKMKEAMNSLSELILTLQGDGDYDGVAGLVSEKAIIGNQLQADLDRLAAAGIPRDIYFDQGVSVLGL